MQLPYALLAFFMAASTALAVSIATVQSDITAVHKAATALNKLVQDTNGRDQLKDLDTDSAFQQLVAALNTASSDLSTLTKKATTSQFKPILTSLKGTEKTTKAVCTKIAHDQKNYDKAGISNVISYDIRDLTNAFSSFHTWLKRKAPSSAEDDVKAVFKKVTADLKICRVAFPITPPST